MEQPITNIDKILPVITENSVTATANSITFSATDEPSGIKEYAVTESSTAPTNDGDYTPLVSPTDKLENKEVTGLKTNITYYIWVRDQAGNVNTAYSIKTEQQEHTLMREDDRNYYSFLGNDSISRDRIEHLSILTSTERSYFI